MEKIKTGIPGFDEILKGGLRRNSSLLITGAPGTGKTIFGLQFIYEGAKLNEPGLFITSEETPTSILEYSESIGFKLEPHIKKGMITIVHQPITSKILTFSQALEAIKKRRVKRVALDSLTIFEYMNSEQSRINVRKEVLQFLERIKESGATFIAISEREVEGIDSIVYKPQDFLFEGLVLLTKIRKGASFERCITVAKMRGQDHLTGVYPFKITDKGIETYPKQLPFSLIEKSG